MEDKMSIMIGKISICIKELKKEDNKMVRAEE
jgi:hypothetical protein